MEENYMLDTSDDNIGYEIVEQPKKTAKKKVEKKEYAVTDDANSLHSCLKNERVIVRFIKKPHPLIKSADHVAAGGLIDGGNRYFCLPMLSSGTLKNCLTNDEKAYLEYALGLEDNELSVYNKHNNYWLSGNGNAEIKLGKEDTYLDLSNPHEYIIYKMLLANSDTICPSLIELERANKATYQYVIVREKDEAKVADDEMGVSAKCYMKLGQYQDNKEVLRTVIEVLENKEISDNTKIEFLRQQANNWIKKSPKQFLNVIDDKLIEIKVTIKNAVKSGIIARRGAFYYMTETNDALCNNSEDPTLDNAAKFLNDPKRQDLLFSIQAKLNA